METDTPTMKILYMLCGVAFAGKSTLAKKIADNLAIPLVSLDGLYFEHESELPSWGNSEQQWQKLLVMSQKQIRELLMSGRSVVFDNTNLQRTNRDELRAIAKAVGAKAVVVLANTPVALLDERQKRNKTTQERHDVEQHYVDQAKAELEFPSPDEEVYTFTPESDVKSFIEQLPR